MSKHILVEIEVTDYIENLSPGELVYAITQDLECAESRLPKHYRLYTGKVRVLTEEDPL